MTACHCHREKDEHYENDGNCMRQCDCTRFRDSRIPEARPTEPSLYRGSRRPHTYYWCTCTGCKHFDLFGY